jgi:type IV secretion system protein VirB4
MNRAITCYSEASFGVIAESLGLEAAFWAQFPGNQAYIFRAVLITSQNYVDFCPMHNYRTGYVNQNHLGGAVSLLETPSKTPMFFNFHARGSGKKNDLTPGHTTIIGGNGSGKSVFMGFMDSQMSRYGGRSYFFDRDRGLEIYIRATGGSYWVISPNHPEDSCFNPFALEDTALNRAFLKTWMKQLVRREDETELDSKTELMLSDCVDYAFESLLPEHRYLSMVCRILPLDFSRWDRLRQWLRQDGRYSDGEYSYLFDNHRDNFKIKNNFNFKNNLSYSNHLKMGFDFTELHAQPHSVLTSVCMYLMHQIKTSLDGSRVSIFFDEGWQILDNPYWQHRLKQDLPTFRKMNAHLILATQSPESILGSALSAQFLDNSATHIFFCNPNANFEKHYRHFHITASEFNFLAKVPQELRWFLYKQGQESAICKLNLSGMDAFLAVYSGNKTTLDILDKLRAEVGDDPEIWLPLFCKKVLGKEFFKSFRSEFNFMRGP